MNAGDHRAWPPRPLLIAMVLALSLHLAAAVALSWLNRQPPAQTGAISALEFELIPSPEPQAPAAPPEPAVVPVAPEPPPAPPPLQAATEPQPPVEPRAEESEPPRARPISAAQILASRDQVLASLSSNPSDARLADTSPLRRRTLTASTREYMYANYLESWRRKVERIGNLNYPEHAKEKHLYGSLVLQVAVRADGSLESVRVRQSSGHQVLDEAAIRIVELAAPFAPFPDSIRAQYEVLDIVRTWQFLRNQQLGWGN